MGQAVAEKEAVQKWCPEARVATVVGATERVSDVGTGGMVTSVNRHPERRDPFEGAHCVGAQCMHWLWLAGGGRDKKGYCGLSGRP